MKRLSLVLMMFLIAGVVAACSPTNVSRISPDEYVAQFADASATHLLIDVRTPTEFASGHIPGAINIPVDQIASRLGEIPSDMPVIVYCQSGTRSGRASGILSQNGYDTIYDLGGIINWRNAGYPVQ